MSDTGSPEADRRRFIGEGDVRRVIEKSTYTTTLKDLERRGKNKVRVVKARQIYRLIAEAVNQVIERSSLEVAVEERDRLVEASKTELDRILREHHQEEDQFREQQRRIEKHLRRELEETLQRMEDLRRENEELRARLESGAATVAPPRSNVSPDVVHDLVSQMNLLREGVEELRRSGSDTPRTDRVADLLESHERQLAQQFEGVFGDAMQKLSERIESRLDERDAEKAQKDVEEAEVVLDSLFTGTTDGALESNIERVGVRRSREGGVASSIERLRSMGRGRTGSTGGDQRR